MRATIHYRHGCYISVALLLQNVVCPVAARYNNDLFGKGKGGPTKPTGNLCLKGNGCRNNGITNWLPRDSPNSPTTSTPTSVPVTTTTSPSQDTFVSNSFSPPTSSPSRKPSLAPTSFPTMASTEPPTLLPTKVSTINEPIPVPTRTPTAEVTVTMSKQPTNAPTFTEELPLTKVTTAPTLEPTSSFLSRTRAPVVQSSSEIEIPTCIATNGAFGLTSGIPMPVSFGYEVEMRPDVELGQVLGPLEQEFVNFLLPFLFSDICAGNGDRNLVENDTTIGISSKPEDKPATDIRCQPLENENNSCAYVHGQLTLFFDNADEATIERITLLVLDRLEFGMDSDSFVKAHPGIERVTFVEGYAGGQPPTVAPTASTGATQQRDLDSLSWWPLVIAGGGTLALGCFVAIARRRRNEPARVEVHEDQESTTLFYD